MDMNERIEGIKDCINFVNNKIDVLERYSILNGFMNDTDEEDKTVTELKDLKAQFNNYINDVKEVYGMYSKDDKGTETVTRG